MLYRVTSFHVSHGLVAIPVHATGACKSLQNNEAKCDQLLVRAPVARQCHLCMLECQPFCRESQYGTWPDPYMVLLPNSSQPLNHHVVSLHSYPWCHPHTPECPANAPHEWTNAPHVSTPRWLYSAHQGATEPPHVAPAEALVLYCQLNQVYRHTLHKNQ